MIRKSIIILAVIWATINPVTATDWTDVTDTITWGTGIMNYLLSSIGI